MSRPSAVFLLPAGYLDRLLEKPRGRQGHSKIQDLEEPRGCIKPPSERPRKKNKTSREVGKHQETSVDVAQEPKGRPKVEANKS